MEGLTLAGINEAANRRSGIQVEKIDYKETEHSWIATAEAVDTMTGNSRYGAFEQPKMQGVAPIHLLYQNYPQSTSECD